MKWIRDDTGIVMEALVHIGGGRIIMSQALTLTI